MRGGAHIVQLTQQQIKIAIAQYVELMFQTPAVPLGHVSIGVLTSQAAAVHGAFFYADVTINEEEKLNVDIEHGNKFDIRVVEG